MAQYGDDIQEGNTQQDEYVMEAEKMNQLREDNTLRVAADSHQARGQPKQSLKKQKFSSDAPRVPTDYLTQSDSELQLAH